MKKRITIDQLVPEMYVVNLKCDWKPKGKQMLEGRIANQHTIDQLIARGIRELNIDTARGIDVPNTLSKEEQDKINQRIIEEISQEEDEIEIRVDVRNEMSQALSIYQQARDLIDNTLVLVKRGKPIDAPALMDVSNKIANSISRNPSALMCIGRIRDKSTYLTEHLINSGVMMGAFSLYQRIKSEVMIQNILSGLLHDIGMILVPDEILKKTEPLSEDEFKQIRMHVGLAKEILNKTPGISELTINTVAQHHERVDGKGYPLGLINQKICESGRMLAIIGAYDAISGERSHCRSSPPTTSMKKLLDSCDKHLDTKLVHRFIKIMGVYPVGSLVHLNNDKLGIVMQAGKHNYKAPLIKVIYNAKTKRYLPIEWLDLAAALNQRYWIEEAVNPRGWGINVEDFLN